MKLHVLYVSVRSGRIKKESPSGETEKLDHFRGHGDNLCPSLLPNFTRNNAQNPISNGLPGLGEHHNGIVIKDDPSPIESPNGRLCAHYEAPENVSFFEFSDRGDGRVSAAASTARKSSWNGTGLFNDTDDLISERGRPRSSKDIDAFGQ